MYVGAHEMYNDTTTNRRLYSPKLKQYRKEIIKGLKENFIDICEISYRGKQAKVLDYGIFSLHTDTIIELINSIAENLISQWFDEKNLIIHHLEN